MALTKGRKGIAWTARGMQARIPVVISDLLQGKTVTSGPIRRGGNGLQLDSRC